MEPAGKERCVQAAARAPSCCCRHAGLAGSGRTAVRCWCPLLALLQGSQKVACAGVELIGLDGTLYDQVLDTIFYLGLAPPRFQVLRLPAADLRPAVGRMLCRVFNVHR